MRPVISLSYQLSSGIFLALAMSILLQFLFPVQPLKNGMDVVPTATASDEAHRSFQDLSEVWMVQVEINRLAQPRIVEVSALPSGRLTNPTQGDAKLQIIAADGQVLYETAFHPVFTAGDPPRSVDKVKALFIVPMFKEQQSLRLETPQGEVIYDLPK